MALADGHGPQLGVVAKQPPMLIHQRGVDLVLPTVHGLERARSRIRNFEASSRLLRSRHEPRGLETGRDTGKAKQERKEKIMELTLTYCSTAESLRLA